MKSMFRSRLRVVSFVIGSSLGVFLVNPIQAAPGDLDPTFGVGGKVLTDFSGNDSGAGSVALQTDGKIVVAGDVATGTSDGGDFALARYNPDGTLDSTFGAGGRVTTDFAGNVDSPGAVLIQADGKIVAAGQSQNATGIDFVLARYNVDGSLDLSFGPDGNGKVRTRFPGGISKIYAAALQTDQKIVAAGRVASSTNYDFALARYNTDGSLDQTFGSNGLVTTDFLSGLDGAYAVVIQPDKKIIAAGIEAFDFALARYNADGSLDMTFGPDGTGKVHTDFGSADQIGALVLQPDGAIVAAGSTFIDDGINQSFALARYLPNGVLDASFGSGGKVTTDFSSGSDAAQAVVLQADGAIIAGGFTAPDSNTDFALARYLSNGSLDSTFGIGGKVTTDPGDFGNCRGLVLQPDGKLIAAGTGGTTPDFAVARYLATGPAPGAQPLNISTRAQIGTSDSVLIGGFIITGNDPKQVIVRAIGPSLSVDGVLADPVLELHEANGTVVTNDNWRDTQEEQITATGLAPTNDLESAIVATLTPGAYTAIVSGQGGGTGVGLVEAYDLQSTSDSQLANISTRGSVGTDDNVMIGGFILGGSTSDTTVVVRGLGPSLGTQGVANTLADPTIDLYDSDGAILASNDNWQDTQKTELEASGLAPTDPNEAAILMPLSPRCLHRHPAREGQHDRSRPRRGL